MKNAMKRLGAVLALSLVIVFFVSQMGLSSGRRTDGIFYKAGGIHPDAQMMQVDGEIITAEEYLYWVSYVCEYLKASMGGQVDFSAPLNETMTLADYAKQDAANTVKLYAVTRAWAREAGVTLTEKDTETLDAQRQQYLTYYGGEEGYQKQLELLGISEAMMRSIDEAPFLYAGLHALCTDPESSFYPAPEALEQFAADGRYVTARLLYFATVGMEEDAQADVEARAEQYAQKLQAAEDKDTAYEEMARELGFETDPAGLTISPAKSDPGVCAAVEALEEGEVSGVIRGGSGFYVAVRMPLDEKGLLEDYFASQLQQRQDRAEVEYNDKLYEALDVAEFDRRLGEERLALMQGPMGEVPTLENDSK